MTDDGPTLDEFDFFLPPARIAARPAVPRDSAGLLEAMPGEGDDGLTDYLVRDLPLLLEPGDILVMNDTKVIPAQLTGRRGAARVGVTLHLTCGEGRWRAFTRPAKRLSTGDRIDFAMDFGATVVAKGEHGEVTLDFGTDDVALAALLERHGAMPLPPYIPRPDGADDRDRADYQTLYAARPGAVAAPTAGLHFTLALFAALEARGVGRALVTLHTGAGTFLPVRVARIADHRMHAEYGEIDEDAAAAINEAREAGGRVVAVGTTSLRLLETAADEAGRIQPFAGTTDLFITPGYVFRAVDGLLTNFHLPKSTLFILAAAFAGTTRIHEACDHAIRAGYRFFSYGDACLLWPAGASREDRR